MPESIIVIGPAHPLRGGLSSFNERLAREAQQHHFQTSIFTFSLQYPGFLFPGSSQYSNEPEPKDLDIHVRINSINPLNWLSVGFELKKRKPDYILVRYWLPFMAPCLGTILRIVKQNKHTKIVCLADNVIPHEKRPGDTLFTCYMVGPIHAFITMSEKVLNDLKTFTNKPATQIVHPLYDHFGEKTSKAEACSKLSISNKVQYALFFGFIRAYKGLDLLLEAIHLLKEEQWFEHHAVKFLIAGEFYEDDKPYRAMIEQWALHEHLVMHDHFITDSSVRYYFSAAACVLQPYKNATQSGVTPLSFHYDVPVIVTNVGSMEKYVPEQTGLLSKLDAASFAAQIKLFFTKPEGYFTPGIQQEKKKYSWEVLLNAITAS